MDNTLFSRIIIFSGQVSIVTPPCYNMGLLMQRDGKSFEDQLDTSSPQFCAAMCGIVEGKATPTQMCV